MPHHVYLIENALSGAVYVGRTRRPDKRWSGHLTKARRGGSQPISRAIASFGEQHFVASVLETHASADDAKAAEASLIVYLRSLGAELYNVYDGDGSPGGTRHHRFGKEVSAETRARISAAKTGTKMPPRTVTHRERLSASKLGDKNPNYRHGRWARS